MRASRRNSSAFTLVELLVVVAIMALIMMFAMPKFQDIGRGSKMRGAVNELRSTIGLARQWAVANRQPVYVMLPDDWNALYAGLSSNEYTKALHSYAVFTRPTTGGEGSYLKDWTYLPAGVFFVDQYNSANPKSWDSRLSDTQNALRQGTVTNLPFPEATSSGKPINVMRFNPDGTCPGITPYELYLSEGVQLDGSGGKVVNVVWKDNPVLWGLEVNPFTGNVRVNDYSTESY